MTRYKIFSTHTTTPTHTRFTYKRARDGRVFLRGRVRGRGDFHPKTKKSTGAARKFFPRAIGGSGFFSKKVRKKLQKTLDNGLEKIYTPFRR